MANASDDDVPEAINERLAQIRRGMSFFDDGLGESLMRYVAGDTEIEGWERVPPLSG